MKTLSIIRLIIGIGAILAINLASAQQIVGTTYVEKTHISPKLGYAIGFVISDLQMEVGAFHQNTITKIDLSESYMAQFYERTFSGIYMNYPVLSHRGFDVKFNIRMGVTNKENFAITPSVKLDYQLIRNLKITTGIGIRAFQPTYQSGIALNF